eukprot:2655159-Rhodomonas_salina.1
MDAYDPTPPNCWARAYKQVPGYRVAPPERAPSSLGLYPGTRVFWGAVSRWFRDATTTRHNHHFQFCRSS